MNLTFRSPLALALIVASLNGSAEAGDRFFRKRVRPVYETATTVNPDNQVAPSPMLGSFQPSALITIRRNNSLPGGEGFGNSLAFFGPTSVLRSYAAPVTTVVRGYDGIPTVVEGTAFSTPNFPAFSPVVYPTRANNYSALRYQGTPPQIDRGTNWIDHN